MGGEGVVRVVAGAIDDDLNGGFDGELFDELSVFFNF